MYYTTDNRSGLRFRDVMGVYEVSYTKFLCFTTMYNISCLNNNDNYYYYKDSIK